MATGYAYLATRISNAKSGKTLAKWKLCKTPALQALPPIEPYPKAFEVESDQHGGVRPGCLPITPKSKSGGRSIWMPRPPNFEADCLERAKQ